MSLLAYKDGTFIDLADAYEQNLITKDAIKAASIWNNSTLGDAAMSCCPEVIDRQMQKYYESLWSNMGNESFGTWYTEDNPDGDWRYYGPHFLFYCGGEQEEVFTTIQIGGITFSHPTTFQLYALDSEPLTLISLAEYYEEWGNTETIAEIAQLHKQTNDAIYGEGWDSQENTQ